MIKLRKNPQEKKTPKQNKNANTKKSLKIEATKQSYWNDKYIKKYL